MANGKSDPQDASSNGRVNLLVTMVTIGFSLWAGVVGFASYLIIQRVDRLEATVSEGVLPLARQRIEALEQQVATLQAQQAAHLIMYYDHLTEFNRIDVILENDQ